MLKSGSMKYEEQRGNEMQNWAMTITIKKTAWMSKSVKIMSQYHKGDQCYNFNALWQNHIAY